MKPDVAVSSILYIKVYSGVYRDGSIILYLSEHSQFIKTTTIFLPLTFSFALLIYQLMLSL